MIVYGVLRPKIPMVLKSWHVVLKSIGSEILEFKGRYGFILIIMKSNTLLHFLLIYSISISSEYKKHEKWFYCLDYMLDWIDLNLTNFIGWTNFDLAFAGWIEPGLAFTD